MVEIYDFISSLENGDLSSKSHNTSFPITKLTIFIVRFEELILKQPSMKLVNIATLIV